MDIDNLPAGLPSDFNNEKEPKMKVCPGCVWLQGGYYCPDCDSTGEIEMTAEEIQDEKEERNEPNNL